MAPHARYCHELPPEPRVTSQYGLHTSERRCEHRCKGDVRPRAYRAGRPRAHALRCYDAPTVYEAHTIETEAIEAGDSPYGWKVVCSCGWTHYCRTAEETQEAVYEHRSELLRRRDR